ncbi:CotH kinase family protein [Dactylosporangium sp. NBC_01737]|uniref:CotH kinase family protein n=1 Tax=Dactylosporangium sp. NBC_01737 TaxID=2975959 RepID=UPI002E122B9B|nr:CotH kinase family protein [Dactylosporangium sp. NBC_01737]
MRRRLVRRIPVRVRQYWKLLAVCAAFLAVLTLVFGTDRVRPFVTSPGTGTGDAVTVNITGGRDLFDATVAHTIRLTFRDADYQRMLDAYFKEGEKDYLEADLTVDGVTVPSVGIRLKGNSTLAGLTRNGQARQDGFRPGGGLGGPVQGMPVPAPGQGAAGQGAAGQGAPGAFPGGGRVGGFGGFGRTALKAEQPETLPWLISFDTFVDGRRFQGHKEIAVRVAGMGGGSAVLNEALALDLLRSSGEVTSRYAYSSFTVNGRPTTARLLVEHPDRHFAEQFDRPGVLYKALSTSQFTDQGDDPVDYQDDFKQVTGKGTWDLQPVIELIRWVDTAGDAEFDRRLAEHVDVASFARYVALQNLLLNFDDMAGPGRNYYLWLDAGTGRFSVVAWDHNLTFSGSADQGPYDGGRMGGRMGGHRLKERALASPAFKVVYEQAYRDLYRRVYAGARALSTLDAITKVLGTVVGNDPAATSTDAERLRTLLVDRTASLATDPVITG